MQFLKFVNFRENYSLEFAMWFLFAFGPYFLAEGLQLSGIMSVLFCGIVMSHYTHYNLTPVTQVTVQQTMRTVSFLAGEWHTCSLVSRPSHVFQHPQEKSGMPGQFGDVMMTCLPPFCHGS